MPSVRLLFQPRLCPCYGSGERRKALFPQMRDARHQNECEKRKECKLVAPLHVIYPSNITLLITRDSLFRRQGRGLWERANRPDLWLRMNHLEERTFSTCNSSTPFSRPHPHLLRVSLADLKPLPIGRIVKEMRGKGFGDGSREK